MHVYCLKSIVWGPLNNNFLSIDKELWNRKVSLLYHILTKIFRRGLIIRCWRFLHETKMVYSWVFWRYLPKNLLKWFATKKIIKGFVSQAVWKNRLRFNFETFATFSLPLNHKCVNAYLFDKWLYDWNFKFE